MGSKHDDKMDGCVFMWNHFGKPIGKVEFAEWDGDTLTIRAKREKPKEEPPKEIMVDLQNASVVYDGMGHAVTAFFDANDEALIPILQHANIDANPSAYGMADIQESTVVKCSTCDVMFLPTKELHYIAMESQSGIFYQQPTLYDAYDCPRCGSQQIIKERKAKSE